MKERYVRPIVAVEEFLPNQNVAVTNCLYSVSASWSKITFRCEEYVPAGASEVSCNDSSEHNEVLRTVKSKIEAAHPNPFATSKACTSVCASQDTLSNWIVAAIGGTDWKVQTINVNGKPTVVARNPSGQHVVDVAGINLYEEGFASV